MPKRYLEYKRTKESPTSKKSGFVLAWIFIGVLLLLGGSYAYLQMSLDGSKKVNVVAGTFQIKYEDQETIKLENTYPMSDEEGKSLPSYQFSVENVGDINANYEVSLEEKEENTLDKKYIRYILKKGESEWSEPDYLSNLSNLLIEENKKLDVGEKENYEIKMWLDINAGNDLQGKTYETRVVVNAVQENGKVTDVVSPTIQLAGELSINVEENELFEDPGIEKITDNQDILEEKNIQKSYEYYDGKTTEKVKNIDTSKIGVYYIYYRIQDQSGNEGVIIRSVNVYHKDTNAPVIQLKGERTSVIEVNGEYIEEGATAIDQEEGDISNRIVTIGTVNTKVFGSYPIKYIVTDQSGNTSSIVRIVNVASAAYEITLDLTNKTSEQIEIEGENKEDLTYNTNGEIADVDDSGVVTAKKIGRTTIEVESKTGKKYIIVVIVEKTVKVEYVQQGLGVTGIGAEEDHCAITEEGGKCSIDLPKINVKDGYTAVGWSEEKDSKTGEKGTIKISDDSKYYAISYKNEVTYKVKFDANGNEIEEESKSCILEKAYNDTPQASSCEITTPKITAPKETPVIVGYNQEQDATEAQVGSEQTLTVIPEINGKTYYAITKSENKEITATFQPQNAGSFKVTDLSGNNKHGSVYGNPKYNKEGLTLDGVDDYVDCGYVKENFEKTFTTIVKFKLNSIPVKDAYIIGNAEGAGMYLFITNDRKLRAGVHDGTAYRSKDFGTIELNTWYEVAMVFNGNQIQIYLNGDLIDTYNMPTQNVNMKASSMPFYIGVNPNGINFDSPLNETVQKAMIYKRVLDAEEIKNIYNGEDPSKENQLFYYNFTENRTKTAKCKTNESYNGKETTGCSITAPDVNIREGYQFLGWNSDKDSHTASISDKGEETIKKDTTYHAITSKEITITYNKNNASAISKESDSCSLWNENDSCNLTSPTITPPQSTPTVIGWDMKKNYDSYHSLIWKEETSREASETMTWYAATKSESKEVTATFQPQNAGSFKATDLSGNNKHGSVYGNPKYSEEGLTLDGVDDYVDCGYAKENFEKTFTTIVKFKLNSIPVLSDDGYIIGNAEGAGMMLKIDKNRRIYAGVHDGINYRGKFFETVELNTWYEIAMVFNGSQIQIYLNGASIETYAMPTPNSNMKVSVVPFYIGMNPNIDGYNFQEPLNETVQKAMIYKRALDDEEIKNIYNGEKPSTENQLFYYDFTENRTKTVKCKISESYNGEESSGCSITAPVVKVRDGYTFLGWNNDKTLHVASISDKGEVTIKKDTTYHAITSKEVTITYNKNNASAISKESDICTLWNESDSCNLTSPTITPSDLTPIVVGWDVRKAYDNLGSMIWEEGTSREASETMTWYACTKKDAVTKNVTYTKGLGVLEIGKEKDSCTIAAVYNGATQATTCQVQLPTITVKTGYNSPGYWTTDNLATSGTAPGEKINLSANTTTYYAKANDTTLPIWSIVDVSKSGKLDSDDSFTITFKGTDTTGSVNTTLTENDITVKAGTTTINPTTKTLGESADVDNGKQYVLTLEGFQDVGGVITIEIAENTMSDEAGNKNIKTTLTTNVSILYKETILKGSDPVLKDPLIPVTIDPNGKVTYASDTDVWYNYKEQKWANAVILVDNPSKEYQEGNVIDEQDIESYFVWIPRYKYELWNVGDYAVHNEKVTGKAKAINIIFQGKNETKATGTQNGEYLTHPAFTLGGKELSGIWVGKFETGYNQTGDGSKSITTTGWNTENAQKDENNSKKVIIKPNVYSWRSITVYKIFMNAYNYQRSLDSHMMKNTEWGAVAYLSHSNYGTNKQININNNSSYLTGYSSVSTANQSIYPGTSGTATNVTQKYNTSTGYLASTTGNITGVYDMSGGCHEYMASYKDGNGVANSNNTAKSEFSDATLSQYEKYLNKYKSDSDTTVYKNRILGDATGEMGPFYYYNDEDDSSRYHNAWYSDSSFQITPIYPWTARGGSYSHGLLAGSFYFGRSTGKAYSTIGSRLVLAF